MKIYPLFLGALAVGTTACASEATTTEPGDGRTVDVVMTDMAFSPATIEVNEGETVTFTFRNDGTVDHEAAFGDLAAQLAHPEEMADAADHDMDDMTMDDMSMDDMDMDGTAGHDGMHVVTVAPGSSIEVTHTFDRAGETMIGCHEPGHWEAGMQLDVIVT